MDGFHIAALICTALILGGGRASIDLFKHWKANRLTQPDYVRNAGFWTDTRILWLERGAVWGFWTWVVVTLSGALFILVIALGDKFGLLPSFVG